MITLKYCNFTGSFVPYIWQELEFNWEYNERNGRYSIIFHRSEKWLHCYRKNCYSFDNNNVARGEAEGEEITQQSDWFPEGSGNKCFFILCQSVKEKKK